MDVTHHLFRAMFENLVADRVYQVGLAKTGAAIDEQGVVSRFARTEGDAPARLPARDRLPLPTTRLSKVKVGINRFSRSSTGPSQ
jgi:hypothetical protein